MKYLIIGVLSLSLISENNFKALYPNQYNDGLQFLEEIEPKVIKTAMKYGIPSDELLAIVFPECCRYSKIKDYIESGTLEYFYVESGSVGADFSIGHFQMKPSFVERLETLVRTDSETLEDFASISVYDTKTLANERRERLRRMQNLDWQLNYISCFYTHLESKYINTNWASDKERVAFYATCYNRGFWKEEEQLKKQQDLPCFPTGEVDENNNASYASIAVDYYEKASN